jgi:hypothetical protein
MQRKPMTTTLTGKTEYIFHLPLPPLGCSPNRSGSWRKHIASRIQYRTTCYWLITEQLQKIMQEQHVSPDGILICDPCTASFCWRMAKTKLCGVAVPDELYRPLDEDNAVAACKVVIDCLKDTKVILSDSHAMLKIGDTRLLRTEKQHEGEQSLVVTLTVETPVDE